MASKYKYGKIKCSICFVTYFALEMVKVSAQGSGGDLKCFAGSSFRVNSYVVLTSA